MMLIIDSFLTGSRRYGAPTAQSDYDICALISREFFHTLYNDLNVACQIGNHYMTSDALVSRARNVDWILFHDPGLFNLWWQATDDLCKIAPVTREVAVKLISQRVENFYKNKGKV